MAYGKGNEELRKEVKDLFSRLYSVDFSWRPRLDGLDFVFE